jgi:DNA-directed RNA polymerase subunit alpha
MMRVEVEQTTAGAPRIQIEDLRDTYGQVVIEPLERGFGTTLGNALRRVLLCSIPGAAVTRVRFSGSKFHEYDTIPGVRESVLDIILNLKELAIRITRGDELRRLVLSAEGEGEVTAGDIEVPSGMEIINPDHHIATLDEDGALEIELEIETGYGYRPAERNKKADMPLGVIAIDSDFSPVKRVNFRVAETRVGERTDFDRLILEIETNGSIKPEEALHHAAQILISHFQLFSDFAQHPYAQAQEEEGELKIMETTLEELGFDKRACNLLKRPPYNIITLGDLLAHSREELRDIHKFGDKSLVKVVERLKELGYELAPSRKKA